VLAVLAVSPSANAQLDVEQTLAYVRQRMLTTPDFTASYPKIVSGTDWLAVGPDDWASSYLPGILWYLYDDTNDPLWLDLAMTWTNGIDGQQGYNTNPDLGEMVFNSFGHGLRLTGNSSYQQVLQDAAQSLSTRFNPIVGCSHSWDIEGTSFPVIIDDLTNKELLLWAAANGGDPAWTEQVISHALRVANDHVRPDGSTYHVVDYDPTTGQILRKFTNQGYSTESTWSRGQTWGMHGFTTIYRYTQDPRFLDTAILLANYFLQNLPADFVPYWDFNAPNIPDEPRDTSAAAMGASALLELSQLVSDPSLQAAYYGTAQTILASLASRAYLADASAQPENYLLDHGTYDLPHGQGIDTGQIWGDYYFVEALIRFKRTPPP
jgi:unsaturated chondroitin disaccharide hydrolase